MGSVKKKQAHLNAAHYNILIDSNATIVFGLEVTHIFDILFYFFTFLGMLLTPINILQGLI